MSAPSLPLVAVLAMAPPTAGTVELRGDTHAGLLSEPERGLGPWVASRALVLRGVEGGIEVEGRFEVRTGETGFFGSRIAGPGVRVRQVRWDGRHADVWQDVGTVMRGRVEGTAVLEIQAFVPGDPFRGPVQIDLMPAVAGTVRIEGEGLRLRQGEQPVVRLEGVYRTGAGILSLEPRPPKTGDKGTVVVGRSAVGLTVGDGEIRGRAHLQWLPRRGAVERVVARVVGVGEDLRVEGPGVAAWKRVGDLVRIELTEAEEDLVDLEMSWTEAIPDGEQSRRPVPLVVPQDVFRAERTVQLARDGTVDVAPQMGGWTAIAGRELPPWGTGLVDAAPTATFRHTGLTAASLDLDLFRFTPVEAPSVVVDVADHLVAATEEGRVLIRTRLAVRNERASHLRIHLPPGAQLLGISVNNRPIRAARAKGGARLVPLPRSVETMDGMLTFPVVIAVLGQEDRWRRRGARKMELVGVDAPVNVSRTTVHLPPGYASRLKPGEHGVVAAFTRGEAVAFGFRDEGEATQADTLFKSAVDAWNDNDFEIAQERLDDLREMDAKGKKVEQLQSNVDIMVNAPAKAPASGTLAGAGTVRRIRAQARARADKLRTKQRKAKKDAREHRAFGRYKEAEREYRNAVDASQQLDKLEDEESRTYDFEADELEGELEEVQQESANRDRLAGAAPDEGKDECGLFGGEGPTPDVAPWLDAGPIVLIPTAGEAVYYQHLLLEPGARRVIRIDAKKLRFPRPGRNPS